MKHEVVEKKDDAVTCDYLVIGAGASGLAFVDTLLTQMPELKVVIVDKHQAPGGHWNDAYDFVRLHQPSVAYGVESKQLEGNWLKCLLWDWKVPFFHRATKHEILTYFGSVMKKWVKREQVSYYPSCEFDKTSLASGRYIFASLLADKKRFAVTVREKIIDATLWEPRIPCKQPLLFPVDEGIQVATPNDIFFYLKRDPSQREESRKQAYLVLGCGKTAMDTVIFLMSKLGVSPDSITLVVPNDVWMFNRYPPKFNSGPWDYFPRILDCDGHKDKACTSLEEEGLLLRFDKSIMPKRCRLAVIEKAELKVLTSLKNIVRRGRVKSIKFDTEGENIEVAFERPGQPPLTFPREGPKLVVVNACSPGPFNGQSWTTLGGPREEIFKSQSRIQLSTISTPPAGLGMSALAYLESARKKGTLDIEFGRKLLQDKEASGEDILKEMIRPIAITDFTCNFHLSPLKGEALKNEVAPIVFPPLVLTLGHKDVWKAFRWMKRNRLSPFNIPGYKSGMWANLKKMLEKKDLLGLSEIEETRLRLIVDKLKPLKNM